VLDLANRYGEPKGDHVLRVRETSASGFSQSARDAALVQSGVHSHVPGLTTQRTPVVQKHERRPAEETPPVGLPVESTVTDGLVARRASVVSPPTESRPLSRPVAFGGRPAAIGGQR